jgi:RNA polymerase sigma-70 factor (ECF subfamily)
MSNIDLRRELEALHHASFGWAMCCCRERTDEAEDLLQTVYMKVLAGRARFDGRSSLRTWLFGVILRTAREQRRRQWLHALLLEKWHRSEQEATHASDPEDLLRGSEQSRELQSALRQLPRRQQQVLHLVFYQDLTIEESASALGVSLGTARTHFERGKQGLRGILGEAGKQ